MRRVGQARKRDANEAQIVQALRQCGASVIRLSEPGVPDLLVLFQRRLLLMEIKTARGRATSAQDAKAREGWPSVTCRSISDALGALEQVSRAMRAEGRTRC